VFSQCVIFDELQRITAGQKAQVFSKSTESWGNPTTKYDADASRWEKNMAMGN
jgi:hypothetical protein